jgi:DnaK suppressor protein
MLNDERRKQIENLLLREREQVLDALGHFEDSVRDLRDRAGELSLYDQHMADYGSEGQEQEKQFLLASVEGRRLYALDEALSKLYREPERFGACENCGRAIAFERLEVVPEAKLCADCQRAAEGGVDADPREASSVRE